MKKKVAARRKVRPATVDDYIDQLPDPARSMVKKLRATIRAVAPADATEVISYGIPAFRHNGMLVWYAGFSSHCSLFPGAGVLRRFKDDLKDYTVSKGTVRFPLDKPLPVALVRKLVKAKIAENETKKRD